MRCMLKSFLAALVVLFTLSLYLPRTSWLIVYLPQGAGYGWVRRRVGQCRFQQPVWE